MDKKPLPIRKANRSLVRKAKQPLVGKFNNPFHKFRQDFPESKIQKIYQYISLRKYLFLHREFESRYKYSKDPLSQRDMRFYIRSRKEIHYRNIDSISRFIGLAGRIIPRRVTKITLRHQRLMTSAIKKARFLALLPFIENELHFKKKWQDILARRKKRKDEKKNKKKRRSIPRVPRVPPLGTETDHPNPLRGLRLRETLPDSSGNPKREPRVPPLGTETDHPNPLRGLRLRETLPESSGNPKREPRVPPLGTETDHPNPLRGLTSPDSSQNKS